MNKQTHQLIMGIIYDDLDDDKKDLLSKIYWLQGAIYPDIHLSMRLIHHSYKNTIHIVLGLIDEILSERHDRSSLSHKLGVISHFIIDYATAYHSNPRYKNRYLTHLNYEKKIHQIAKLWIHSAKTYPIIHHLDRLEDELETYLQMYHTSCSCNPARDVEHAYSLTHSLIHLILKAYIDRYHTSKSETSLRIAIFSDTYYPHINGVSNTLYHMMRYFDSKRIPYVLVSPKYKDAIRDKEVGLNIIKVSGVRFLFYPQTMMSLPIKRRLDLYIDEFRPNTIYAMTEFNLGIYGQKYAARNHLPFISNYSTHFHLGLRHMHLTMLHSTLFKHIISFHNRALTTTTPSKDTEEYLKSLGIMKTFIFSRGIDTNMFSPEKRNQQLRIEWNAVDKKVLLYVGRVSGEKNLDVLINAYEMIPIDMKRKTVLVIAGDGPLLSDIKENHPEIITTGFVTGEDLQAVYASSDLFVFPSTSETLGNVVLEAMASGLAVIGVNQGGVKENIVHGYNGLLVNQCDSRLFSDAIIRVLSDKSMFNKLQSNALSHSLRKTWPSEFDKLMSLFNSHHYCDLPKERHQHGVLHIKTGTNSAHIQYSNQHEAF